MGVSYLFMSFVFDLITIFIISSHLSSHTKSKTQKLARIREGGECLCLLRDVHVGSPPQGAKSQARDYVYFDQFDSLYINQMF